MVSGVSLTVDEPTRAHLVRVLNERLEIGREHECWTRWSGGKWRRRWALVCLQDRRHLSAARAVFLIKYGSLPVRAHVWHGCGNAECLNPAHLALSRPHLGGAHRSPRAKLTEAAVSEIRAKAERGWTGRALAREYHVSPTAVSAVLSGRTWATVSP
jgi:hypothetical protein